MQQAVLEVAQRKSKKKKRDQEFLMEEQSHLLVTVINKQSEAEPRKRFVALHLFPHNRLWNLHKQEIKTKRNAATISWGIKVYTLLVVIVDIGVYPSHYDSTTIN